VPWGTGSRPAPTWLYVRQSCDAVRIEVHEHGSSYDLVVDGPGLRRRLIECEDTWAVIERQIAEETHLLALGYTLERFTLDRREQKLDAPVTVRKVLHHRERTRS
jgi:hypothetical protein